MNGKENRKTSKKKMPFSGLLRLLAKQVLTTAICAVFVLTAHYTGKEPFSGYTKALGSAIRYEINTEAFKESGSAVWEWIRQRLSKETEGFNHEKA